MKNNPEEGVMKCCSRVCCIFCGLALLGLLGCRKSQQNVVEVGSNVAAIRAELEKIPDIRDMKGAYKYPGELFSKIKNLPEKDERIRLANEFIAKLFADDLPTLTPDARSAALCARFRMACVGAGEVLSLGFKGADATDVVVRMLERYGEEIHFQKWKTVGQNRRYAELIRSYLRQDAAFVNEHVLSSDSIGLSISEKKKYSKRISDLMSRVFHGVYTP